ncbi:MAG: FAD-binding oxidoreductase [Betaproteobacteria bacterium]|nr:FAD-binding oxidoreductase [Betaproteobacteria bacterium]
MGSAKPTLAECPPPDLLEALEVITGPGHVLTGDGLQAYERDWRRRSHGRARAVVRPADAQQVARVVQVCAQHRVSLVPQGGHTGLVGGGTPDETGTQIVLSTQRLNHIREVDADNLTMTVEAGCILQTVQAAAAELGLLFPLSLAAEGSCTIGGNLSTNAGGTQVLRYGNARSLCLGLEVVTAEGCLLNGLSGLHKDNTGYDLRDLYIGSEGTLGVITAATLKLFPQPAAVMTALASCASPSHAVALLRLARARLGATLTGLELMNRLSRELVAQHLPQIAQPLCSGQQMPAWSVLLEQSDDQGPEQAQGRLEDLMSLALQDGLIEDVAVAKNLAESRSLWHLREAIPLAQAEEGLNIKHDISLPVSRIPAFIAETDAALEQAHPGCRLVNFGHLGDGNLHYNVQAPPTVAASDFLRQHEPAINTLVYDAVQRHQGSISAEHGIGRLKRDELAHRKDPVALSLMKRLKAALDPEGTLNPGRVI